MRYDAIDIRQSRIQSFAFIISIFIAVFLSWFCISYIRENNPAADEQKIKIESRINPNDAPIASLIRLPGVGLLRAKAIVEYRENFTKAYGDIPAFQDINDLQKIKGIGPETVKNMAQWLTLE